MTIEEADRQSANPNVDKGKEFRTNCQTCSPAYVLRQWGFDVTAKGNTEGSLSEYLSYSPFDAWENIDGTNVSPTLAREWLSKYGYKQMTEKRWNKYFNETCKEEGTYLLTIGWKGGRGGHATILQKTKDGLFNIEPQEYDKKIGAKRTINEICRNAGHAPREDGILRVDNKLLKKKFLSIFEKGI